MARMTKEQIKQSVLSAISQAEGYDSDELDQLRTRLGRQIGSSVSRDDLTKIVIDIPSTLEELSVFTHIEPFRFHPKGASEISL